MRIVSLLPSATEILFVIGAGDDVVGVTFECDYPPQARQQRIVSTSSLPEGLDAAGIDAAVRARIQAGEDLYHLDADALADLDADLVVTQNLCAVCAVDVSEVHDALDYLGCRAQVLTLDPHRLDEVLDSVARLGEVTGRRSAADELLESLRSRIDAVGAAIDGADRTPTLVLEWTDPPFAPGHWVPELVERAGGHSVLGQSGEKSYETTWPDVISAAPQVIICAPCGFGLEDSARLTKELIGRGALPAAVPVWAVDANGSFARPGPRLVDGLEAVAAILHPDRVPGPNPAIARRIR